MDLLIPRPQIGIDVTSGGEFRMGLEGNGYAICERSPSTMVEGNGYAICERSLSTIPRHWIQICSIRAVAIVD